MKRKLFFVLLILFGFVSVVFCNTKDVSAGGAVISTGGTTTSSGSSSYGISGGGCTYSGVDPSSSVDCAGVSWIFYKSTGNAVTDIVFTPIAHSMSNSSVIYNKTEIDQECSEHTDSNGGFWHFGRNAQSTYRVNDSSHPAYFVDYEYLKDIKTGTYLYSTSRGSVGHWDTYNYGFNGYADKYYFTRTKKGTGETYKLDHVLYKDGVAVYRADHFSEKDGQVLADYKKAHKYYCSQDKNKEEDVCKDYGEEYTGNTMPSGAKYFCYWDEMDSHHLTVKAVNVANGSSISDKISDKISGDVTSSQVASVTRGMATGWTFLGFANTTDDAKAKSFITNTNTNSTTYISDSGTKINVKNLTDNKTLFAVYGEDKTLTAYARPDTSSYFKSDDGAVIDTTDGAWTNSKTVNYGSDATVTTANFNPTGYSWRKWGTGGACKDYGEERSCTVKNLTSNTTVNAYYTRNEFQARARVAGGKNWSSATYKSNSGYVKSGNAETVRIECTSSDGCKAGWWFDLITIKGTGKTTYTIEKRNAQKNDDGTWTWSEATNGSVITNTINPTTGGKNVYVGDADLKLGQTVCYRISYKPFGDEKNSTIKRVSACAYVVPSTFQGKSNLSGAASTEAGWTTENKSINEIAAKKECSATDGCTFTFKHYLKRTAGIGSTEYTVKRTSNLTSTSKKVTSGTLVSTTSFGETGPTLVSESSDVKLYPGMVVCEILTFKPNNKTGTGNIHTKVCASALGNAQPGDPGNPDEPEDPDKPSGDTSFINIKVRNENFSVYNKYQREIYARPGNTVTYRATYNPILQYTFYLRPEKMQINNGQVLPKDSKNSSETLGTMFNNNKGSGLSDWNNDMAVFSSTISGFEPKKYDYSPGSTTKKAETNSRVVVGTDVGKSLNETAITNKYDATKTTPSQVTFSLTSDNYNKGNVDTLTEKKKTAYVRVPYNYVLTPEISAPNKTTIPAGEEFTVKYSIEVEPRPNRETTDNPDDNPYATVVGDGMSKLIVYYPDSPNELPEITDYGDGKDTNLCAYYGFTNADGERCGYITKEHTKTNTSDTRLNKGGNLAGTTKDVSGKFYVRDLEAGSTVCFSAAVYPSNSGSLKNWSEPEGNKKWSISKSKCYTISKKPSIEVWGGNVFSHLPIETSVTKKNNLEGYTAYNISKGNDYTYVFGSFGELGVISSGNVTGFASGAGTGFALNDTSGDDRGLWPGTHPDNGSAGNNNRITSDKGPGGSKEKNVNFCNRTPLSFSNENCGSGDMVKAIGTSTANDNNIRDKSSIISKLMPGKETNWDKDDITISDTTQSYVYVGDRNLTIDGGRVSSGIKAIHSNRTIAITNDIIYEGSYSNLLDVPKVVIYAMSDIIIDCNVDRIDALLIANNKVKTCDSDDIEAKVNSNQLVVNGAIIAKNLIANRTYGAATGANSIIPAEIINFDSTLYLWGGADDDSDTSSADLRTTYLHELSPRY